MICPKCNKEIPDGSKFCLECGSNISAESGEEGALSVGQDATLGGAGTQREHSVGEDGTLQGQGSLGDEQTMPPAAGESAPGIMSGTPLSDRYDVEEEIGGGAFARVYRAKDRKLGRTVAVKRLRPEKTEGGSGDKTIERFSREAQAIAGLNHRNIVQVHDTDRDDEGYYIVMEYVDGGTLGEYLQENGKLTLSDALPLFTGIARGLAYAHRHNLVHRDIKPGNALLSREGDELVPKIVDFGLARAGADSDVSVSGYGMGTPYYMPPEQRRDAKNINHTADIYAAGKILYEMVTGEVPDNVDPEAIPQPPELSQIIFKSIKSRPEERYFSMDDILRDLESLPGAAQSSSTSGIRSGTNPCPSCGSSNPEDVKFCEHCGTGMTRLCPECERENSVHKRFCGGCGTDVEAFATARDTLKRMEQYSHEKKWSRVRKEFGLLPQKLEFFGEKGKELQSRLQQVNHEAKEKITEVERLANEVKQYYQQGKYGKCQEVVTEYLKLNPHNGEMEELQDRLPALIEQQELQNARNAAKKAVQREQPEVARGPLQNFLEKYSGRESAYEIRSLIKNDLPILEKFQQFKTLYNEKKYSEALDCAEDLENKLKTFTNHQSALLEVGPCPNEIQEKINTTREDIHKRYQEATELSNQAAEAEDTPDWQRAVDLLVQISETYPEYEQANERLEHAQAKVDEITKLLNKANDMFNSGYFKSALNTCFRLLQIQPGHDETNELAVRIDTKRKERRKRRLNTAAAGFAALLLLIFAAYFLHRHNLHKRFQNAKENDAREKAVEIAERLTPSYGPAHAYLAYDAYRNALKKTTVPVTFQETPEDYLDKNGNTEWSSVTSALKAAQNLKSQGKWDAAARKYQNAKQMLPEAVREAHRYNFTKRLRKGNRSRDTDDAAKFAKRLAPSFDIAKAYSAYCEYMSKLEEIDVPQPFENKPLAYLEKYGGAKGNILASDIKKAGLYKENKMWEAVAKTYKNAAQVLTEVTKTAEENWYQSRYKKKMQKGHKAVRNEEWDKAIAAFKDALDVENYSGDEEAESALNDAIKNKRKSKYKTAMSTGRKALESKNWTQALTAYQKALQIEGYEDNDAAEDKLLETQLHLALSQARNAKQRGDWKKVKNLADDNLPIAADDSKACRNLEKKFRTVVKASLHEAAAEKGVPKAQYTLGTMYSGGQYVGQDAKTAAKWYHKAAKQGDPAAEYQLGVCYGKGVGVEQDNKEAAKWYRKAAEQNHPAAQFSLGVCYDSAKGVKQDYGEAVKWYREAAQQGNARAQHHLALSYQSGQGVEADDNKAAKWFSKAATQLRSAAKQGNPNAQYKLATYYKNGYSVEPDPGKAVGWCLKAAKEGHAKAQFLLGWFYQKGWGLKKNYDEALKWYRKAAEKGDPLAQFTLGMGFSNGRGVDQDYSKAVKWVRKAAKQGLTNAQGKLALYYEKGQGVEQDYRESIKWYRKAAEQGDAKAQYSLGWNYYYGKGVEQNDDTAKKWFEKAAEKQHPWAQFMLAQCFALGDGVEQNLKKAMNWYNKAANQGVMLAQYELGRFYYHGQGVQKDYERAVKWFKKAANQGHRGAKYTMALCYQKGGHGIEKNKVKADMWFDEVTNNLRKAAEKGKARAQHLLGECLWTGRGFEKNRSEAIKWYRQAAEQGNPKAQFFLGRTYQNRQNYGMSYKWYSLALEQGIIRAEALKSEVSNHLSMEHILEVNKEVREWLKRNKEVQE